MSGFPTSSSNAHVTEIDVVSYPATRRTFICASTSSRVKRMEESDSLAFILRTPLVRAISRSNHERYPTSMVDSSSPPLSAPSSFSFLVLASNSFEISFIVLCISRSSLVLDVGMKANKGITCDRRTKPTFTTDRLGTIRVHRKS